MINEPERLEEFSIIILLSPKKFCWQPAVVMFLWGTEQPEGCFHYFCNLFFLIVITNIFHFLEQEDTEGRFFVSCCHLKSIQY